LKIRAVLIASAVSALSASMLAFGSPIVLAQQAKPTPGPHHHHAAKPAKADAGADTPLAEGTPTRGEPEAKSADAGILEAKTLDGGTRVFRFGEVEIEGRLRNPQLVYFLRRVRAEFSAGDLGHRTFMRELSDTRHDPSF
jgi:hypothetical protein